MSRGVPLIDWDYLHALRLVQEPGEADIVGELSGMFAEAAAGHLTGLRAAAGAGGAAEIRRLAHLLCGSAAQVGAARLAASAADLEARALAAGMDDDLRARVEDVCRDLEAAVAHLTGGPDAR